jgi:iron-sulfur cluster assembly protein
MLALTEDASAAISGLLEDEDLPESAGLRITAEAPSENSGGPGTNLQLTVVAEPDESDQVLEEGPVYLAPGAAAMLDDKVLDANVSGDQVQFTLQGQR